MARYFDGVDDIGKTPTRTINFGQAITVGMWIKPTSGGWMWGRPITAETDAATTVFEAFNNGTIGKLGCSLELDTGAAFYSAIPPTFVMDGRWYYWSMRWQSGQGINIKIWNQDGSIFHESTGSTTSGTLRSLTNARVNVGMSTEGNQWQGHIARVFVHNSRLTDTQLNTLRTGESVPVTPYVDYWEFPEGDNDTTDVGKSNGIVMTFTGAGSTTDTGLPSLIPKLLLAGSVAAAGLIKRGHARLWDATLPLQGSSATQRVVVRLWESTIPVAGLMTQGWSGLKTGVVSGTGALLRHGAKVPKGDMRPLGDAEMSPVRRFESTITTTGSVLIQTMGRVLGRAGTAIMTFYGGAGEIRMRFRRGGY